MKSNDVSYVPLLLKNSGNPYGTSEFGFKGVTVYEEDMYALQRILRVKAPNPVSDSVDSVNIKFFIRYWLNYRSNRKVKSK
jgi:hypothetical protein